LRCPIRDGTIANSSAAIPAANAKDGHGVCTVTTTTGFGFSVHRFNKVASRSSGPPALTAILQRSRFNIRKARFAQQLRLLRQVDLRLMTSVSVST